MDPDVMGRLMAGVKLGGPDGTCWQWTRGISTNGYGRIKFAQRDHTIHRTFWEWTNGPIPDGLYIDHKCRNKACGNPTHLRLVTPRTNSVENSSGFAAENAAKTHCPRDHPLLGDNLAEHKRPDGSTYRSCRRCVREVYNRNRRKARKARNAA